MLLLIFVLAFVFLFVMILLSKYISAFIDFRKSKKKDQNSDMLYSDEGEGKVIEITDYEIKDDGE